MPAHRLPIKVRFGELDPYNHVNHAVYVAYFEAGRCEALEAIGYGLPRMAELGWQVVVANLSVAFKSMAVANDQLVVLTWIGETGNVVGTWHQQIRRLDSDGGDGALICEATVRVGAVGSDGRPKRLPPEFAAAMAQLSADA
jgi:acyl-CoA thioester hydrolase